MKEEFENSIRKKLNEADHPFDPQAWEKMEALLDAEKDRKPVFIWWSAAALLLLLSGIWWLKPYNSQPGQTKLVAKDTYLPENHLPESHLPGKKEKINSTPPPTVSQPEKIAKTALKAGAKLFRDTVISAQGQLYLPDTMHNNYNGYTKKENDNVEEYTKIDSSHKNEDYKTVSVAYKDSTMALVKPKTKKWYAGIVLGPDLTVAPSFKYGNIGFNAGIALHYYFNRNLFITTGVIYSKKIYGATARDYRTGNYNTPYGILEKVNANCEVLDIPINMNYTFLSLKKNKISATLGFSNYFMLKEKYQYLYEYGPPKERTIQNENRHYLSIINAGILYQRPATRGLLLGVQPYVKIPLSGVGYGQVKLYSAGMTVHLTFTGRKP
ncbi:hypothetical protein [Chitinophaga qingshengii]|uniref:Outer membrane protein beta-barrel domain-containing protein n=1 Tax=Chitinophaga qingshengii TaxID=1569794 RepID=A0ABR7TMG3_9BACT|nr:hypothetical protein [Chitinophaga qingshengii]MBC9931671.1 hypothetical protein [Chitinophaga qingshengii]